MNTEINKKISQFLDDELDHKELEGLLIKIRQQPELKNKMNRYQTMSQALKTNDFIFANEHFLDKINQELKLEPHYFPPKQAVKKRQFSFWQKTTVAIAASIVGVAVIVTQPTVLQNAKSPQKTFLVVQNKPVEVQDNAVKKRKVPKNKRIAAYLQAHSDDLYTYGSVQMHSFASVASYDQD